MNIAEVLLEIVGVLRPVVAMRAIPPNNINAVNVHLMLPQVAHALDAVGATINATNEPIFCLLLCLFHLSRMPSLVIVSVLLRSTWSRSNVCHVGLRHCRK